MSNVGKHTELGITKNQLLEYQFELICVDISLKAKSLHVALEGRMSHTTFDKIVFFDSEKMAKYMRARDLRADLIFEQSLEIADETIHDKDIVEIAPGVEVEKVNNEAIQRSRLRVETRKWFLSKLNPKKYGEKLDVTTKDEKIEGSQIIFIPTNNHEINGD